MTRPLRVGDKICRTDDPRHSGAIEALNRYIGRAQVRWYPSHYIEYLDIDELTLARDLRRRIERENEAAMAAFKS